MAKALVLALGGMITAILTRLFGDELRAWMPWFTERLLRIAIESLPEGQRERFSEEWASHINEVPGQIGKVAVALGCVCAAPEMASLLKNGEPILKRVFTRSLDIAISAVALLFLAPIFLCVVVLVKLDCAGESVLSREERVGANGGRFLMFRFRLGTLDQRRTAERPVQEEETTLAFGIPSLANRPPRVASIHKRATRGDDSCWATPPRGSVSWTAPARRLCKPI